jgi:hypothetical protein
MRMLSESLPVTDRFRNRLSTIFAQNDIRPGTATPGTGFEHHLIGGRCLSTRQCLPMRHAEHMRIFALGIPALEGELQWIDLVPVLVIAIRTALPVTCA